MKNNNMIILLLVLFLGFNTLEGAEMKNIQSVSIVELIANSEKYQDEKIRVVGFLKVGFEAQALYLSEADYENAVTKNALWVSFDKRGEYKKFNQQYVLIEGIFDAKSKGHLKMYSATIREVDRVILWGDKSQ